VASQLSNLPTIETEDFTLNVIVLEAGVTAKTGACAWTKGISSAAAANNGRSDLNVICLSTSFSVKGSA